MSELEMIVYDTPKNKTNPTRVCVIGDHVSAQVSGLHREKYAALFAEAPELKRRAEAAEARAALNESAMDNLARKLTATEKERDELRGKLEQAQHDLEVCRIEIEHLTRKAMTTPKYLDDALNKGDGVYRP